MRSIFRALVCSLMERRELIETNVRQAKDIARLTYERDDALNLITDLRLDLEAGERVRAELMRSCPADASALMFDWEVDGG